MPLLHVKHTDPQNWSIRRLTLVCRVMPHRLVSTGLAIRRHRLSTTRGGAACSDSCTVMSCLSPIQSACFERMDMNHRSLVMLRQTV